MFNILLQAPVAANPQQGGYSSIILIVLMIVGAVLWCSCEDVETYADMKEKERACIEYFIQEQGIKVITKEEFERLYGEF